MDSHSKNGIGLTSGAMVAPLYLHFWGKAQPEGSVAIHPAAFHMLDVMAVAQRLYEVRHRPEWLTDDLLSAVLYLIGIHDLGKLSRRFAAQSEPNWPTQVLGPFVQPPSDVRHDSLGLRMARHQRIDHVITGPGGPLESMSQRRGRRNTIAYSAWLRASMGHHGYPVEEIIGDIKPASVCSACVASVMAFCTDLASIMPPQEISDRTDWDRFFARTSWHVAGMTNLADWIGSSQKWFPYVSVATYPSLAAYWPEARRRAEIAVREAGLERPFAASLMDFKTLFPHVARPTPTQRWAYAVPLPEGPILTIIEDVTGSGKTEAALGMLHRIMSQGRAQGAYFALPTMASSNAMYGRLAAAYRQLFAPGSRPSLILAHSKRNMSGDFQKSVIAAGFKPEDMTEGSAGECAAWIADDRRTALLADIGVGSIDQALLSVLPNKHAPLRLLGLSGKVLIIDEAHAYDDYMESELVKLVQFHTALGGHTIILSATLPSVTKRRLIDAYETARRTRIERGNLSDYPMATMVAGDRAVETPLKHARRNARTVMVERLDDEATAVNEIVGAACLGAAVVWVRNTVTEAIHAADLLRGAGLEPILFHARFAVTDRQRIEDGVLELFGKKRSPAARRKRILRALFGRDDHPKARRGQVLVATQVVEQSLDLDFDLMVSDVAPIDLLIQRMGRLWRHLRRNRPVALPRFLLVSPEPVEAPHTDWLSGTGTRRVYTDLALLWRSARTLMRKGRLTTPEDVRPMVEEVYAPDAEIPVGWGNLSARAETRAVQDATRGDNNTLVLDDGYRHDSRWAEDNHTATRLMAATLQLRLARLAEDGTTLVPWHEGPDPLWRAWALSEVTLREMAFHGCVAPVPDAEEAVAAARAAMAKWQREIPVVLLRPVEDGSGGWVGSLRHPKAGSRLLVQYHPRGAGLTVTRPER